MNTIVVFLLLFANAAIAQTFRLSRPVNDNIPVNASYLYGEPNINNPAYAHNGLDISAKWDTVRSASDGSVVFIGYNPNDTVGGYEPTGGGNYIIVRTTWNTKSIWIYYMHLKKPLVGNGQVVTPGMVLAISGNTGNSTGAHLHFEIRENSSSVSGTANRRNAELWICRAGNGAIYGRVPNAANSTRVDISPDPKPRPPYTTYSYSLTYNFADVGIGSDDIYNENYAIGDVKPGTYTIRALNSAYLRVVTVQAGQVVNADAPSAIGDVYSQPDVFQLFQNYPNPFNPTTIISYQIPKSGFVSLVVYDALGREIKTLVNEEKVLGKYSVEFNADNLPSGVYFYTMRAGDYTATKKLLLMK